jgi:hypothetical protein
MRFQLKPAMVLAVVFALNGCQTIGPASVPRDRMA